MANPEHLALLKQGIAVWNEWRQTNPYIEPDLHEANLYEADLERANLHEANLYEVNLEGANLLRANLEGANLYGVNLREANLYGVNLHRANLREANLHGADLHWANLREANLHGADLRGANLHWANLREANLHGANLREANLEGALLHGADLHGADLEEAFLHGADLHWANLGLWKKLAYPEPEHPFSPSPEPLKSVLLSASTLANVQSGEEFTVHFVAYLQEFESQVDRILKGLSPRSKPHLGIGQCRWQEGVKVTVMLSCQYLDIAEPQQTFEWHSPYLIILFNVVTQQSVPKKTIAVLKFDIYIENIRVAQLRLDLRINSIHVRIRKRYKKATVSPATTAFASYANDDRLRVLNCITALQVGAGMDIFQDCLSLHPGESWKEKLLQEILDSDLFLLFWSKFAKDSQLVKWEWTTALERRGEEVIQPYPLDTVEEAPPPSELAHLHFGSHIMRISKSYEATIKANP